MMTDDYEERFRRHEAIMEGLARMLEGQKGMNERQEAFNRQQVEINQDVKTTLARIETLLSRMFPTGENGREAFLGAKGCCLTQLALVTWLALALFLRRQPWNTR